MKRRTPLKRKRKSVSSTATKRHALVTSTQFHNQVFSAWGDRCYFCGGQAVHAMHIVSRWRLGKHRYSCPIENGRPGCFKCHELNTLHLLHFAHEDELMAIRALNAIPLKEPLQEPYAGEEHIA